MLVDVVTVLVVPVSVMQVIDVVAMLDRHVSIALGMHALVFRVGGLLGVQFPVMPVVDVPVVLDGLVAIAGDVLVVGGLMLGGHAVSFVKTLMRRVKHKWEWLSFSVVRTRLRAMPDERPVGSVRSTRQREAVADLLERTVGFSTAQGLHRRLQKEGASVGLTTVYRALRELDKAGLVDVVPGPLGVVLYHRCQSRDAHLHVVCRQCGYAAEVHDAQTGLWAVATAESLGFTQVRGTMEVLVCVSAVDPKYDGRP